MTWQEAEDAADIERDMATGGPRVLDMGLLANVVTAVALSWFLIVAIFQVGFNMGLRHADASGKRLARTIESVHK
jgi:hypothetical protein